MRETVSKARINRCFAGRRYRMEEEEKADAGEREEDGQGAAVSLTLILFRDDGAYSS